MADVSAARTKAVFEFKSATLPLIAVILKTSDLDVLAEALDAQLADSPDFFEQEPVVIDLSLLQEAQGESGEPPATSTSPPCAACWRATRPSPSRCAAAMPTSMPRRVPQACRWRPCRPLPRRAPRPPAEAPVSEAPQIVREVPVPANGTLLIDKPLRSGQQVYARGGDVVVTAVVSFGAEVIADGNVHVYAPLRGKAIAGARGNTEARIFSTCMEAQLVAIAGIYRTNEVALPDAVLGKSAQVRLDGKKIAIDPIP